MIKIITKKFKDKIKLFLSFINLFQKKQKIKLILFILGRRKKKRKKKKKKKKKSFSRWKSKKVKSLKFFLVGHQI